MRQVADVYAALPAQDKPHTVLLTGNYGEAGALDRYGKALGLPMSTVDRTSCSGSARRRSPRPWSCS